MSFLRFRRPTIKWLREIIKDKKGSEALEFVYGAAICCFMILSCMMIIGYALQVNAVSYAGKRIARYVEVTGKAPQNKIDDCLDELLVNSDQIEAKVTVSPEGSWWNSSQKSLQLRDKFAVTIDAVYKVKMFASPAGDAPLRIPIHVVVDGQSEIYWKS